MFLKLLRGQFLGDLTHEDVVVNDLLRVATEEIVVEGEGTGRLTWSELEVAHLLAGKSKLVLLRDCHDSRVEWAVQVTSDLWHT